MTGPLDEDKPSPSPKPKRSTSEAANVLSQLPELEDIADLNIPFDSSLDVAAYINAQFPDEATLEQNVDPFLDRLDSALARLDAQLADLVRDHRLDGDKSAALVQSSLASVTALQSSLDSLTIAAEQAENDMRKALEPARPVYVALENAAATAAALESLVKLDSVVTQLEKAATEASLMAVAEDLSVFDVLRDSMALFDSIPATDGPGLQRLPELRARATVATETLRGTILSEFKRMSDVVSMAGSTTAAKLDDAVARLRTACLVAEAMGKDVKAEVIGSFIKGRKLAFRAAFEMDSKGLSGAEKRFAWLRRELRMNWARLGGERVDRGWGAVFPDEWGVAWRVADGIVRELNEWTSKTLDAGADRDVAVMVSALSKTKDFEVELDRRFSAIRDTDNAAEEVASFVGAISETYGPWMGAYVNQEDEHLQVVLQELLRDEKWICEDGTVLRSATELFLVIKKSMRTCASLDIRQPLFSLHRVFRKHLGAYAANLVKHLPGVQGNALADSSNPKDFEQKLLRVCAIISTAEYCSSTIEELEESLQKTVQEVYAADIELSKEREKFSRVTANGIQSIVALMNEDLEPQLQEFAKQNWASWPEVGDNSKYVETLGNKTLTSTKFLADRISKHHFRFMLEKFAASFIPRYRNCIYDCPQMNNFGAQQILLDVTAVKAHLLGLPASVRSPVPATYVKYINREMAKMEAMLKVVLAPSNASVDTYLALVPDGSAEHFQKILEIRGLRRADAAPLVLDYSRRIGPERRLKPQQSDDALVGKPDVTSTPLRPSQEAPREKVATSSDAGPSSQGQQAAVDSVKSLFGRLGTSLKDSGITDRLGQVSSQFESTTQQLKKEAAARGFRFGQ